MYMVRKRFMYWHIPATTKLHLSRDRNACYCFSPARLVKAEKKPGKFIIERLISELVTPISKRKASIQSFSDK